MTSPAFSSAERLRPESTHPIGSGANSPYSGKPMLPKPAQICQCAVMLAIPTCVARPHRLFGAIPPAARTYDYDRQHTPSVDCLALSDLERISSFTPRTAARRERRRNHDYDGGHPLPALPNAEPGETKNLPRYSARTARPTPRRRHSPSPKRYSYDRRQDYDPLRSLPDCIKRPSRPHHARAGSILRSYDATCGWFVAPNSGASTTDYTKTPSYTPWVTNNATTLPTSGSKINASSPSFPKDYTNVFNAQLQQTRNTFAAAAQAVHQAAPLGTETVMRLEMFRQMVTDHAAFDLKTNQNLPYNSQAMGGDYEMYNGQIFYPNDFGNYNYGVAAKAFGFSQATAQNGAEVNQLLKSGSFDTQRSHDRTHVFGPLAIRD